MPESPRFIVPIPDPCEIVRMIDALSSAEVEILYAACRGMTDEGYLMAAVVWFRRNRMDIWRAVMGDDPRDPR